MKYSHFKHFQIFSESLCSIGIRTLDLNYKDEFANLSCAAQL